MIEVNTRHSKHLQPASRDSGNEQCALKERTLVELVRGAMFPAVREVRDALHEFEATATAAGLLVAAHPVVEVRPAANERSLHLRRLLGAERLEARAAEHRRRALAARLLAGRRGAGADGDAHKSRRRRALRDIRRRRRLGRLRGVDARRHLVVFLDHSLCEFRHTCTPYATIKRNDFKRKHWKVKITNSIEYVLIALQPYFTIAI